MQVPSSNYIILPIPIMWVFVVIGSKSWSMFLKKSVINTGFYSSYFFSFRFLISLRVFSIKPGSNVFVTFIKYYLFGKVLPLKVGKYLSIFSLLLWWLTPNHIFYTENSLKLGALDILFTCDYLSKNFFPQRISAQNFLFISRSGGQYIPHLFWK